MYQINLETTLYVWIFLFVLITPVYPAQQPYNPKEISYKQESEPKIKLYNMKQDHERSNEIQENKKYLHKKQVEKVARLMEKEKTKETE